MDTVLWAAQVFLAVIFLISGAMKAIQPREQLAEIMPWVEDFSESQIRLIGLLEILGVLGLILPGLTGNLPWLTPMAAMGLALTMVVAGFVHLRRKEYSNIIVNVVLLLVAIFVVYGRLVVAPL